MSSMPSPEPTPAPSEKAPASEPASKESKRAPAPPPVDPRFERPVPSPWKRAALLLFLAYLFYLGFSMRLSQAKVRRANQDVIYASRYSKEHKYRPAASPIITERLKDGRTRIRGAAPAV